MRTHIGTPISPSLFLSLTLFLGSYDAVIELGLKSSSLALHSYIDGLRITEFIDFIYHTVVKSRTRTMI